MCNWVSNSLAIGLGLLQGSASTKAVHPYPTCRTELPSLVHAKTCDSVASTIGAFNARSLLKTNIPKSFSYGNLAAVNPEGIKTFSP